MILKLGWAVTFQSIYSNYGVLFKHDYILADVVVYNITQTE